MDKSLGIRVLGLGVTIGVILGLYRSCMGIMEKKMETVIMSYIAFRVWDLGFRAEGFIFQGLGFGFRI